MTSRERSSGSLLGKRHGARFDYDGDRFRLFDTNGDGVLDASDTSYGEFRVWQDLDRDGEVDEGELRTLAELRISQINLTYDNSLGFEDTAAYVSVGLVAMLGMASFVIDCEVGEAIARNPLGGIQADTHGGTVYAA
ncbi:hypothetical protein KUV65_15760 [Maritalea mobilis]|uniref:hypothetical protein n=1 Tax=Maritalea mobilis TaxID=483324 RepID=UPI001C948A18|nr:hypothetical protein [Maritalea mobilis]MBY6202831.1 hypothetical protein [Maritalea mobilis]